MEREKGFESVWDPAEIDVSGASCAPAQRDATTDHGELRREAHALDVHRLRALAVAARELLSAGLAVQARPLLDELVSALDVADGERAAVVDLTAVRSRRET